MRSLKIYMLFALILFLFTSLNAQNDQNSKETLAIIENSASTQVDIVGNMDDKSAFEWEKSDKVSFALQDNSRETMIYHATHVEDFDSERSITTSTSSLTNNKEMKNRNADNCWCSGCGEASIESLDRKSYKNQAENCPCAVCAL